MTPRAPLPLPPGDGRVLLLACCAPCCGEVIEAILASGLSLTVFFYNPNIQPREEYDRRKAEVIRLVRRNGAAFVDADYDPDRWQAHTRGLEQEPERGRRCEICFDLRLERTARHALDHGFAVFTSSLGISRWKDMAQVNACGHRVAARHPGLTYWDYNWRKNGGTARMVEVARREGLYQQDYCGCPPSRRSTPT
ncbi:epoxyqueuosine reductase QueH [Phaeospirillum tilakii]|uniref:Epoxyqueuosine reductase QueH n=1 Tax=Phaeospirillum tilakii TaxID=741673 RepID=A0ABW5CI27_9PROT